MVAICRSRASTFHVLEIIDQSIVIISEICNNLTNMEKNTVTGYKVCGLSSCACME